MQHTPPPREARYQKWEHWSNSEPVSIGSLKLLYIFFFSSPYMITLLLDCVADDFEVLRTFRLRHSYSDLIVFKLILFCLTMARIMKGYLKFVDIFRVLPQAFVKLSPPQSLIQSLSDNYDSVRAKTLTIFQAKTDDFIDFITNANDHLTTFIIVWCFESIFLRYSNEQKIRKRILCFGSWDYITFIESFSHFFDKNEYCVARLSIHKRKTVCH